MSDGPTTDACPECESCEVYSRETHVVDGQRVDVPPEERCRCRVCGATFPEPAERQTIHTTRGLGKALAKLDPEDFPPGDELVTDGGVTRPRYPHLVGRLETTRDRLERTRRMVREQGLDEEIATAITDALAATDAALDLARGEEACR